MATLIPDPNQLNAMRESLSQARISVAAPVDASMNHKVQAAAKLALQDLDPESLRQRYKFMSSCPTGVLAIHLRHLTGFSRPFFNISLFNNEDILALHVVVTVNFVGKQSRTVHVRRLDKKTSDKKKTSDNADSAARASALNAVKKFKSGADKNRSVNFNDSNAVKFAKNGGNFESIQSGKAIVGIDSLRHYQVELAKQQDDEQNVINIDLIYEDQEFGMVHKIGECRYHIFDFLGVMNGAKSIDLMNPEGTLEVCTLEIDFAYRYGIFGYGYSHQVEQNGLDQKYILSQSIFPRVAPPRSRRDDDGLCSIMHVDYPEFVNLEEKSYIGSDPIHRAANKVSEEVQASGEHILEITLNPFSAAEQHQRQNQRGVDVIRDGEDSRTTDSDDDDDFGDEARYLVSSSEQARFITKVLNKRQRYPKMVRQYASRSTRFERIKYLEHIMSKRGEVLNVRRTTHVPGGRVTNTRSGESKTDDMELADIMLEMAPGVTLRSKPKEMESHTSFSDKFRKVGKKLQMVTSLLQMKPSKVTSSQDTHNEEKGIHNLPQKDSFASARDFGTIQEVEEEKYESMLSSRHGSEMESPDDCGSIIEEEEEEEIERDSLMAKAGRMFGWK